MGSSYPRRTTDCAARWSTTSGWHSAIAFLSCGKSRMSARIVRTVPTRRACSNRFGWVGGSSAYPVTSAPRESSHSDSQLPLKPVCPVTNTLRPFQNGRLSMHRPGEPRCKSVTAADSKTGRLKLHRMPPAGACSSDSCDSRVASGHRAFCSRQSVSTIPLGLRPRHRT